jgi:hypothetical protein
MEINKLEISRVTSNTARAFGQSNKEEVSSVVANNAGISPTNA